LRLDKNEDYSIDMTDNYLIPRSIHPSSVFKSASLKGLLMLMLLMLAIKSEATVFTVTSTAEAGPGSLRAAIRAANLDLTATAGSPHIVDASGVSGIIVLDSAMANVQNHMIINGPANNSLTIARNPNVGNFTVFIVRPVGLIPISAVMNNLVITQGRSLTGGGVLAENCFLVMNQCRITGNTVNNGLGGGICTNNAQVEMYDCTVDNNKNLAGLGGGVYMNFGSLIMNNCTSYGNRAAIGGGIDKATIGSVIINNCTFTRDTADDVGGALYINFGNIEINNTILSINRGINGSPNAFGTVFSSFGHNFIDDLAGFTLTGNTTGNVTGTPGAITLSPNLAFNGGPTPTVLLLPCSPAIDAGTSDAYTNPATARDQRGILRSGFGQFDIGAVEYSGPLTNDVSRCGPGDVTLFAFAATNYRWYDVPVGGTPLFTGQSFTVTVTDPSTTFYVADFFDACESVPRIPVVVTVLPLAPQPTVSVGGPTTFCDGGSVLLSSSTDPTYVSFEWAPFGGANQDLTATQTGVYTVTVTDINGCSATSDPVDVTVNPNPAPVVTASGSLDLCFGSSLTLSSSIATGNDWSPNGETTDEITVSSAGNYFTTVTDANGCTGVSNTITVNSVPLPVTPVISASGPLTFCDGGSVELTSNVASGNLWSPGGETTESITVSASGTYSLTVTDANGCTSDPASVTVTVNPLPTVSISANGPTTFCQGANVELVSTEASNIVWSPNGETTASIFASAADDYFVSFTDANGCTGASNTISVTVLPNPTAPVISANGPTTFCQGQSVLLSSDISGVVWSTTENTQSISVSAGGTYFATITDGNNCSAQSNSIAVTVNPLPVAPVISANGPTNFCQGGSVVLTSDITSGIVWSTGETTASITVSTQQNVTVTFTDANGCEATSSPVAVTVFDNPAVPTINPLGPTTFCQGGSVVLFSSSLTGNSWSNGSTSNFITVTATGTFTVTVTDGNNCSATSLPITITVNDAPVQPVISPSGPTTFCQGGSVDLLSSAAANYLWNPGGANTQSITVSSSGTFTVTVTDANGCTNVSDPVIVSVNTPTPANISGINQICTGNSTVLTASAGSSWLWNTAETTQTITVSTAGPFSVVVTDANGCTSQSPDFLINIVPSLSPVVSPSVPITICSNESVVLSSSFASGNIWTPTSETTESISVNTSGSYFVTVTDANGCTGISNTIVVTVNPAPASPAITPAGPVTQCGGTVTLNADVIPGVSYLWNDNLTTTADITVSSSGNYFVTVTAANNCTAVSPIVAVQIDQNPLTVNLGGPFEQCGGTITLDAGNPGSTYLWSTGETTQTITVSATDIYSVQVTNSCGTETGSATVTIFPAATPVTTNPSGIVGLCQGNSLNITSSEASGIVWTPTNETTATISVSSAGTYFVTFTDANGCTSQSAPVTVLIDQTPVAPVFATPIVQCPGTVFLDAGNAGGSTTYLWSPTNETTQLIEATVTGLYSVQVSNACGTVNSNIADITILSVPPTPTISANGPTTFCIGGSVVLTSSAASNNLWNTGATTQSITVSQSGSFFVSEIAANGCSSTSAAINVTVDVPPTAPNLGGPITQCGGTVTLDAGFFGGSTTFAWSNGETTQSITVDQSGDYSVIVTNSCGSVSSNTVNVTILPVPPTPTISANGPTTFCIGGSVVLTSSAASNNLWNTGATTQSITVSQSGSFFVSEIAANGCSSTSAAINVTVDVPPTAPNLGGPITQCGGTVTLDAGFFGGSTTFAWSNGATTQSITVDQSGDYSVIVTNSCGSVSSNTVNVTILPVPPTPTISANGPTTFCIGGSVVLTSSAASNNLWNTGATIQSITVSQSGSFFVSEIAANGCSSTSASINVTVDVPPTAPNLGGPITQCGGTVTLDAGFFGGSTTFAWSNGATTQSITVDQSGDYSVIVTNSCGSVSSNTVNVTILPVPPTPTISANSPTTFCIGGSVVLTSSAASNNLWNTGATTQSITVSQSGSFFVSEIAANGCSSTSAAINVTVDVPPTAPNLGGPITQCGGTVTLDAGFFGGSTTFAWSNGETTQSITVDQSGDYSVIVTNSCGSVSSNTVNVTILPVPPTPTISANGPTTFCIGGSVVLTSSAASNNLWNTGATTQSITVSQSGSFFVSEIAANGCSSTSAAINVTVDVPPTAPNLGGPITQCGGTVTLDAGFFGGSTTFAWSNGATTQSITVDQSGDYSVIVTNSCGSVSSNTVNVTILPVPPTPTISANGPTTFCIGGSVVLTSSAASNNLWNTGATTQSITVSQSGSFFVSEIAANGCSSTSAAINVTVDVPPTAPNLGGPITQCGGTVTLDAGFFGGSTTFAWSNGETTQSITVDQSGDYSVIVTNSCGSVSSNTVNVTILPVPPTPTISANGPTTFCIGGSVVLTSSAASNNLWNTGATTQSITVSQSGSFFVSEIAANGCSSTSASINVTVDVPPTAPNLGGPITQCGGTVTLDAGFFGGSTTFAWSNGATTQSITVDQSGDYSVIVTNSCGSVSSNTVNVTILPVPPTPTISANGPTTFCIGGSVVLTSSAASNNLWNTGATTQSITVSQSGSFFVSEIAANGCSSTSASINVTVDVPPTAPNLGGPITQCGGTVTLDAGFFGGSTTFAWSNGATTQTILVDQSGDYSVIVTNSCGSVSSNTVNVTILPVPPTPTITPNGTINICQGASVDLTAFTGATPLSVIWNPTNEVTNTITVSTSGVFTVSSFSGNGCSSISAPVTVNVDIPPTAPNLGGPVTQCGGTVNLDAGVFSPGTTFAWSNGENTQSITVSQSGDYSVIVTNSCGSATSNIVNVTINPIPAAPVITANGPTTFCQGGSVDLTAVFAGVFDVLWSPTGETTNTITASTAGTYSVTITDAIGCSNTSAPLNIVVDVPPTTPNLGGPITQCGGTVTLDAGFFGGSTTFAWSNGETTQSITVDQSGDYSVEVTNSCGSVTSNVVNVTINPLPAAPVITANGPTTFCQGGSVDLTAVFAGVFDVLWSPTGETTNTITVGTAGTYSVTITDAIGCSNTSAAITVVVDNLPTAPDLGGPFNQCGGTVTLDAGIFAPGTTFAWSNGANTQSITVGQSGNYSVIVTNSCGSVTSTIAAVDIATPPNVPFITASGPLTICQGTTVELTSSSATGNTWAPNGETTQSIIVADAGVYTVTVESAPNCSATSQPVTVVVDQPISGPIALGNDTSVCGSTLTLNAGIQNATYVWTDLSGNNILPGNQIVTVTTSGEIFVTVSNACATIVSNTINVIVNPLPVEPVIVAQGPLSFCQPGSVVLEATIGASGNIIQNGHFDNGAVGFTSQYTLSASLVPEATYNVGPNANAFHSAFNGTGAPGGANANFLIVNGASAAGQFIWQQSVTVQPGAEYTIGLSISSVVASNPAQLQLRVDGVDVGSVMVAPNQLNVWLPFTHIWTAGASSTVTISIHSMNPAAGGNDFGVDAIFMNCNNCAATGNLVWSTGATGNQITVTDAGTYFVSLVNAQNCSATSQPVTVTVDSLPVAPVLADASQCGGSVTLDAGNPGDSYSWTPGGETTQTITITQPGVYQVSVDVTNSCGTVSSNTASIAIGEPPAVDLGGPYAICGAGNTVTLDAGISGLDYLWNDGSTQQTLVVSSSGTYTVTVTDPVTGCTASSTAIVDVDQVPVANLGQNITQCGGSVTLDAGNPGSDYLWSTGDTTQTITISVAGVYQVFVTVTNACGSSTSPAITVDLLQGGNPAFVVASGPTSFCTGDSVTLTASPGFSYLWSPGGQTTQSITVSQSGVYGVTVFEPNGCSSIAPVVIVTVNPNTAPGAIISANGPTTFCLGGSVVLTSNSPTGNLWLPSGATTQSITVFSQGPQVLIVSDPNGCSSLSDTLDINVLFPPAAFVLTSGNPNLCKGDTLTLTANNNLAGTYTYVWAPGAETTQSIEVWDPGNYTVTVTDPATGCSNTSIITNIVHVNPPAAPQITTSGNIACFTGTVTLTSSFNGINIWSTGEAGGEIFVTQPGSYFVTAVNQFGCRTNSDTVQLNSSNNIEVTLNAPVNPTSGFNILCYKGTDGVIEADVIGGTEPFNFSWSNGATGQRIDGLPGGDDITYSVIVTDAGGCTAEASIVLTTPPNPLENMPQAFSPDGDGKNDRFIIPGIDSYENTRVWIYNRWGNEVFVSNGIYRNDNAWDGRTKNGQQAPEGTYYIVLRAESPQCGQIEEHRYIELRRK
jgi:large repetitive protein